MARLPDSYKGRRIEKRLPYVMFAQLNIAASTTGASFADSSFLHSTDKPFEVHRAAIHVTAVDGSDVPTTALTPNSETFARLDISDTGSNERLTKTATRVQNLVADNTKMLELDDPYVMEYQTGFVITGDNQHASTRIRIQVAFHGYLLKVA